MASKLTTEQIKIAAKKLLQQLTRLSQGKKRWIRTDKGWIKGSYFQDCPRDETGHCKPSGAGESASGKKPTAEKPKTKREKVEHLLKLAEHVPVEAMKFARQSVKDVYAGMVDRYGKDTARQILGVAMASLVIPIPGATAVAIAPFIALAEIEHHIDPGDAARQNAPPKPANHLPKKPQSDTARLTNEWNERYQDLIRETAGGGG
jgi:hypothetical protein